MSASAAFTDHNMKISVTRSNGELAECLTKKDQVIIGRSSFCDFIVRDETLSRQHCLIEVEQSGDIYITDLDSINGVFIDGIKLLPDRRSLINSMMKIQLGNLDCVVLDEGGLSSHRLPAVIPGLAALNNRPSLRKDAPPPRIRRKTPPIENKKSAKEYFQLIKTFFLFVLVAICIGLIVFQAKNLSTQETTHTNLDLNTPKRFKNVPDSFEDFLSYDSKKRAAGCVDESIPCEYKVNSQTYVFINCEDFACMRKVIESNLFKDFMRKKISQIHLMISDDDKRLHTVYRFHTKYYTKNGVEQVRLMRFLDDALKKQDPDIFWNFAQDIIQVKAFNQ